MSADILNQDDSKVLVHGTRSNLSVPQPVSDEEENKSRHAAVDEDCCDEMAEKYNWQLIDVEITGNPVSAS